MAKKVLVVDDSALIRRQLGELLDKAGYDVGFAKNGEEAVEFALEVDFDVITMDINMPVLDGVSAVRQIMMAKPTPIVMVSSLTKDDSDITFECLEAGAVDYMPKPGTMTLRLEENDQMILQKIKYASRVPKNRLHIRKKASAKKNQTIDNISQKAKINVNVNTDGIVLVGSSTGGPNLIEEIVASLPPDYPYPVCVVQHMPDTFTAGFAQRLNTKSLLNVIEAKNHDQVLPGMVVIGQGGYHLTFSRKASGGIYVKQMPPNEDYFTPSVNQMFFSAADVLKGMKILAVELTGIGDDGADGMVALRKAGAYTIAESEETAVVYGMPKEAWDRGGAMQKLPFDKILKEIVKFPYKG